MLVRCWLVGVLGHTDEKRRRTRPCHPVPPNVGTPAAVVFDTGLSPTLKQWAPGLTWLTAMDIFPQESAVLNSARTIWSQVHRGDR